MSREKEERREASLESVYKRSGRTYGEGKERRDEAKNEKRQHTLRNTKARKKKKSFF